MNTILKTLAGLSEKLPTIELWARLYKTFGSKTFHLGI